VGEILAELLAQLLWEVVGELVLGSIYLAIDTLLVRREKLPESWTKIQLILAAACGPLAGYVSSIFLPHRMGHSAVTRVLSWVLLPPLGGAALAVFNGLVAAEDRAAARRLGWVCGIVFAVGYLAARRWGLT
jgi:hypothetical protein